MIKPAPPDHVGDPVQSPSALNLPNALTVLRLLLVPVFAWLLLREGGDDPTSRVWAAIVFVLASATDFVDGELARRQGLVTTFGKVVDPIADKALTGTALVGLSYLGDLPWWVTIVILVREIGVTLLRFWVIRHGVIPAVARRQGQDGRADGRDLHVPAAADRLAGDRARDRHGRRGAAHPGHRRRLRRAGDAAACGGQGLGVTGVPASAEQVVRLLTERGETVAVAESLTGGLVVAALVSVPGASAVVRGGVVAYMTDLKASLLDVDPELLAREGAVHPDVAAAMARGVADRLGATYGVATTGVAGPDPQDGHPVGEVWVAVDAPGLVWERSETVVGENLDPALGREGIRAASVEAALDLLLDVISSG